MVRHQETRNISQNDFGSIDRRTTIVQGGRCPSLVHARSGKQHPIHSDPPFLLRKKKKNSNINKKKIMQGEQDNMGMGSMMREVQELAEKFKVEEDEQYISPYAQLEKAEVLQEAR
jgi:hypothetical protein